jgi:hypothetical protein
MSTKRVTYRPQGEELSLQRDDLEDEGDRTGADCILLGAAESVIRKIGLRQGRQLRFCVKRARQKEPGVLRCYHVIITDLVVCALEDEELFFQDPIIQARPRVRNNIICAEPSIPVCIEVVLSVYSVTELMARNASDGHFNPQFLADLARSTCHLRLCKFPAFEPVAPPIDLLTGDVSLANVTEEPLKVEPKRSLFSWITDACSRGQPPPPRTIEPAPPAPEPGLPESDFAPTAEFPCGIPQMLTTINVDPLTLTSWDESLYNVVARTVSVLQGDRTPHSLHIRCGLSDAFCIVYVYGFHSLTIDQKRHFVLLAPSRIHSVSVDTTKCLLVSWTQCKPNLFPSRFWSLAHSETELHILSLPEPTPLPLAPPEQKENSDLSLLAFVMGEPMTRPSAPTIPSPPIQPSATVTSPPIQPTAMVVPSPPVIQSPATTVHPAPTRGPLDRTTQKSGPDRPAQKGGPDKPAQAPTSNRVKPALKGTAVRSLLSSPVTETRTFITPSNRLSSDDESDPRADARMQTRIQQRAERKNRRRSRSGERNDKPTPVPEQHPSNYAAVGITQKHTQERSADKAIPVPVHHSNTTVAQKHPGDKLKPEQSTDAQKRPHAKPIKPETSVSGRKRARSKTPETKPPKSLWVAPKATRTKSTHIS